MRILVLAVFLTGCIDLGGSDSSIKADGEGENGGGDGDGCKIEGDQIGEDVVIYLGAKTVTFGNWVAKSGASGEYVGFSLSLAGGSSVSYVVKASTERFPGTSTTWIHPAAAEGGSKAHGISNVDMCDDPDAGGGGGGDGGGGDGGDGGDGPIL